MVVRSAKEGLKGHLSHLAATADLATFVRSLERSSDGMDGHERLPVAVVGQLRVVHLAQLDELSELRTRVRAARP